MRYESDRGSIGSCARPRVLIGCTQRRFPRGPPRRLQHGFGAFLLRSGGVRCGRENQPQEHARHPASGTEPQRHLGHCRPSATLSRNGTDRAIPTRAVDGPKAKRQARERGTKYPPTVGLEAGRPHRAARSEYGDDDRRDHRAHAACRGNNRQCGGHDSCRRRRDSAGRFTPARCLFCCRMTHAASAPRIARAISPADGAPHKHPHSSI